MRIAFSRSLAFAGVLTALVLAEPVDVFAGNVWDGPAVELFSASGRIYLMLASLEMGRFDEARGHHRAAVTHLDSFERGCAGLESGQVVDALGGLRLRFAEKRLNYAKLGAIPASDATWDEMAVKFKGAKVNDFVSMCRNSAQQIKVSLSPLAPFLERKSTPGKLEVWKLLNSVESGLLRGRYFAVVVTGP